METFSVLLTTPVTPEAVVEFIKASGGHVESDQTADGCIERGTAAVFVSLEDPAYRDTDSLQSIPIALRERIASVILLTVARSRESLPLAFEIADKAAAHWSGVISWDGLDDWEELYKTWCESAK